MVLDRIETTTGNIEKIRELELLCARAWPAELNQLLDGWRLRATPGGTRRVNSAWPNLDLGNLPLPRKLDQVERFYARRGQPVRYQVCPAAQPASLDALLEERGYRAEGLTCIETGRVSTLLARAPAPEGCGITLSPRCVPAWFGAYIAAERLDEAEAAGRRAILARIRSRTAYVLSRVDGEPAAVGLGILDGGWLGIYCMATRPEFRRRGCATAVLRALAGWADRAGCERAYLQVLENNISARTLYERLGFGTLYHYHYREAPGRARGGIRPG